MGCYFPFLVFSSYLGFFAKHLWPYNLIFQVSREQEQLRRKYFFHKFGSYSLFSPISHCSLSLLFFCLICWLSVLVIKFIFHVFIFVSVCAVYVWYVISHFFGCVLEEFDFFFAARCRAMLLSFFGLFIGSWFLCQPLICARN